MGAVILDPRAVPDLEGIPIDDDAEPDDAGIDHDLEPDHGDGR